MDARTLLEALEQQHAPPALLDQLTQYLLRESHLLEDFDPNIIKWMRFELLPPLVISRILANYSSWIDDICWPSDTPELRRASLARFEPEDVSLPVPSSMHDVLRLAINNIDFLDYTYPINGGGFELRAQDLVTRVHVDHSTGMFVVDEVVDKGVVYKAGHVPPHVAGRAVWGLVAETTTATHAYYYHYRAGAARASLSHRLLPLSHPLRQVLAPTELGTNAVMARAVPSLLGKKGFLRQCFPYDLDTMIHSYVPWDPLDPTDRRTQLLSRPGPGHMLGDYGRWWKYILDHMRDVTWAIYPTEADLGKDAAAVAWTREAAVLVYGSVSPPATRERVATLLTSCFFAQVRHNFLSSHWLNHIARWYYILRPGPTSIAQATRFLLTGLATGVRWVPMVGRGFWQVVGHEGARSTLAAFYAGLGSTGNFARSTRHPLALPSAMEASAGV
jgi:hypothetical protein